MTIRHALLFMLLLLSIIPNDLAADGRSSLWTRRRSERVFLFHDTQARHRGDLLTIVIGENTNITNRDQRALSKDSRTGALFAFSGSTGGDFGTTSGVADLDHASSSDRGFNGNSQFTSSRGFSDQFTVTVRSVMPNGNLWVVGRRRIQVEGDERDLYVTGIVRPTDIRANNTVQSQYVGDLQVRFCGRGTESRFTHQGWFNRKANRLWPF